MAGVQFLRLLNYYLDMSTESLIRSNIPEFSVTDLASALKRTLEDNYGRIRVRGELSRVSRPASGHLYTSLKDDQSVIDAVCWKGTVSRLSVKPEEGLEVICTGRITTYAPRSSYQLVIESMELAGEGALLKLLEERRKKLAAEGLFDPSKKKPLPFLPETIGVITSPTGAVIRDILHRLSDRFPRRVLLWPVMVQGETAAVQVEKAVRGFNALTEDGGYRPDLLIVARGGGSLEDLMPFNEEAVVRAVSESAIPVISAIGHETDTTLIDHAADRRAPTPTGAAELAVPVRLDLLAQTKDNEKRLINGLTRLLSENRHRIKTFEARLGRPERILETKTQKTDHLSRKMDILFRELLNLKYNRLFKASIRLTHPSKMLEIKAQSLSLSEKNLKNAYWTGLKSKQSDIIEVCAALFPPKNRVSEDRHALEKLKARLGTASSLLLERKETALARSTEKLELLSFENVLDRGYAVVFSENGKIVRDSEHIKPGETLRLRLRKKQEIITSVKDVKNAQES
ncbi:MAG: exodeoxyribonuclease VII large subunit [Alphaproteobacteria bacterium]|nr:exodeoxyribonuclease VII large subunit [Alphaproteobacteria bacterium]MCB9975235.1 exodeoxyribonuclease VII large subunit [Rhodospirillales bacterium]